jgi:hypothetical protein
MSHLLWSLSLAALYGLLGLGATLLILPAPLRRYALPVAPLVGFSLATLAAWYFAAMGARGTDSYAWRLCLLALVPLAIAIYRKGRSISDELLHRDPAMAAALGLLGFLIAAAPSMISRPGLTAISLGNADIAFYAIMARYLKEFRLGQAVGFFRQEHVMIGETAVDRFGAVIASALPASLFSLGTYELQNVATHVFFALMVMMVFIVAREVFAFRRGLAALGTLLVVVNPLLYYTVFHDFIAQIIAMALTLLLVVLHTRAIREDSLDAYRGSLAIVCVATWGLSAAYGHMVPLVFLAIAAWASAAAFHSRSPGLLARWIGFCAATIAVVAAASPERARVALGQVEFFGGAVGGIVREPPGWFVPWLLPSGLFTVPDAFPLLDVGVPVLLQTSLVVSFVALLALGLVDTCRHNLPRFLIVLGWIVPIGAGTLVLAYFDRTPAGWGGYASYKFLSFFTPIAVLCLLAPLADSRPSRVIRGVALVSLAVIAATSVQSSWRLVEIMRAATGVRPEIVELQKVEAMPSVDSVNLPDAKAVLDTMWKANFMARKTLYIQERTYFQVSAPRGNWTLRTHPPIGPAVMLSVGDGQGAPQLPINDVYSLARGHGRLRFDFGEGWYATEPTLKWMGLEGTSDATLILDVLRDSLRVSIALEYFYVNPQNQLSLFLDGRRIADCPKDSHRCVVVAELVPGARVFGLHSSLAPERPGSGDARVLGFALTKVEIQEVRGDTAARAADAR